MNTLLKAYLVTFWPEVLQSSRITKIGYSMIDVSFDAEKIRETDNGDLDFETTDIAIFNIHDPIEIVQQNIRAVYDAAKQQLISRGLLRPDPARKRTFILRLESIAGIESAKQKTAVRMAETYLAESIM